MVQRKAPNDGDSTMDNRQGNKWRQRYPHPNLMKENGWEKR